MVRLSRQLFASPSRNDECRMMKARGDGVELMLLRPVSPLAILPVEC